MNEIIEDKQIQKKEPFDQFYSRHIVESLYDIANNHYRKNFELNFSTNFYGSNYIKSLNFNKIYGDYIMIKNKKTKYICYNSDKINYLCDCICNDCFEETYSMAKIIGKYKTGEYKVVVLFWWDPYELSPNFNDVRKIYYNDIVGIVKIKDVSNRLKVVNEIEQLPNSLYKSE
jgi:hypothetical protein